MTRVTRALVSSAFAGLCAHAIAQQELCGDNFGSENLLRDRGSVVVKIVAAGTSADKGLGYGLLVGFDSEGLWLAVPAHVVLGESWQRMAPPYGETTIVAQVNNSAERLRACPASNSPRPVLDNVDLTFVCVSRPSTFFQPGDGAIADGQPRGGDKIRLLAMPDQIVPSADVATLRKPDGTGFLAYDGLLGAQGQSGASVTTPRGVIGIFLEHGATEGKILSIAEIEKRARQASVPYQLAPTPIPDCRVSRSVCPVFDNESPRALKWIGTGRPQPLIAEGCVTLTGGKWSIWSADPTVICRTKDINVSGSGDGALKPTITCIPDLGGMWASNIGSFSCISSSDADWTECNGMLPEGRARLRIIPIGHRMSVTGDLLSMDQQSRNIGGELTLDHGRLVGTLSVLGVGPIHVELWK